MLETPVALIIFNRPEKTARVFAEIARARPRQLFVVADGPRASHPQDAVKCAAARAAVAQVDWPCEVHRSYAEVNLGCGRRPASGISWVFEHVAEAIILEDDCVPDPSFFPFCQELLARYRHDERVMMISGTNSLGSRPQLSYSYYFALVSMCWGWASWRRAWQHYDMSMRLWPALRSTPWLTDLYHDPRVAAYWQRKFDSAYVEASSPDLHYWDYQWFFATWAQQGLGIFPAVNLVSNIGYGAEATHTTTTNGSGIFFQSAAMPFPLRHPPFLIWDREADRLRMQRIMARPTWYQRALSNIYGYVPRPLRRRLSTLRSRLFAQAAQQVEVH